MEDAVIVSGVRTAIGAFGGSLAETQPRIMGALVIAEALRRAGVEPGQVDEVLMGEVLQAGMGMNVARQASIGAGIPETVPAMTINRVCGSGLQAVVSAAQLIKLGDAEIVVAGGVESMSLAPYLLPKARFGLRMGNGAVVDSMIEDGLTCAIAECHMGMTAENVADKYGIDRAAQDQFAFDSQTKAAAAIESGAFRDEIVGVQVRRGKDTVTFDVDEHPRHSPLEKLASLRASFKGDGGVTAANASGLNDGAAALVVMSRRKAEQLRLTPMATINGYALSGVDPKIMGIAPVAAVDKVLRKTGVQLGAIDLIEANEAFASQSLAVGQQLGWDWSRVNVNGGAIALGHPIGASGARLLVTLLYALEHRGLQRGLATLCIGGGQGIAMVVSRN